MRREARGCSWRTVIDILDRRLLGMPLANKLGKILAELHRFGHFGMLRAQLGERRCLVLVARLLPPQDQAGRTARGEELVLGLSHAREEMPRWSGPRRLALRLAQALGLAGDRRIAPGIATPLDLSTQAQRITAAVVPPFQEVGSIWIEDTPTTVPAARPLWQGVRAEIARHRIFADARWVAIAWPGHPWSRNTHTC